MIISVPPRPDNMAHDYIDRQGVDTHTARDIEREVEGNLGLVLLRPYYLPFPEV